MKIKELAELLNGTIIGKADYDTDYNYAISSDLMSDVLRLNGHSDILITGLCNMQTVRTAEMAEINVVVLTRGKKADDEMKEHAADNDIVIIETEYSLFKVSGILYAHGVQPLF